MSTGPELRGREAIVFGGAGFIGTHLTARLIAGGASVLVADLQEPARPVAGARFVRADVRSPIEFAPERPDPLVFNLAAVHRTPGHPDHEYFETNVAGARNVTAFCAAHGASSLLFTSSISVYGPTEVARTEASALQPNSAYGASKVEAEQIHRQWLGEGGEDRRLVMVRPAAVFGPGENGNFTRLAGALRKGAFLYPGRKDTIKACGYVDDLVGSLLFMWSEAKPLAVYNYGYAEPPTLEAVCAAFVEVGGLRRPRGTLPVAPVMAAARLLNAIGLKTFDPDRVKKLFNSTNIVPAELVRTGFEYETDLREGIARWHAADPRGEFV